MHQRDAGAGRQAGHVDPVHRAAALRLVGSRHALEAFAINLQRPGRKDAVAHRFNMGRGQEGLPHVGPIVARMAEEILFDGRQYLGLFGSEESNIGRWGEGHCCYLDAFRGVRGELTTLDDLLKIKFRRAVAKHIFLSVVQVMKRGINLAGHCR